MVANIYFWLSLKFVSITPVAWVGSGFSLCLISDKASGFSFYLSVVISSFSSYSPSLKMASRSTTRPFRIYSDGRFLSKKSTSSSWCKLMCKLLSTGIVTRDSMASWRFSIGLPVKFNSTIYASAERSLGNFLISLSLRLIYTED